ncbi:hypothetical protein CYMTET_39898 [Cymbomonas tetramitiformis]|uniref:Uncharacterized protein n=1 Tax=Cymbomonas tetramitiformis TaxID=36881 RepID=A0AAE0C982_9CHLO|nr:hypothetical protein CYMTET_39898 [Cymbomonas tetramitiformis]
MRHARIIPGTKGVASAERPGIPGEWRGKEDEGRAKGVNPGTGLGTSAGAGAGAGAGTGAGAGDDAGAGVGAGVGAGTGVSAGVGAGSGGIVVGAGCGTGAGDGAGSRRGVGKDIDDVTARPAARPTGPLEIPDGDATGGSDGDSDSTHASATDDGDATGDSGWGQRLHPPMSVPLTLTPARTTHVSATDGETISDITMDSGVTHVSATDIDGEDTPASAAGHTGGQDVHLAGLCALESHALPEDRHCKHVRKDGTINKWRYAARSRLASTLATCAKRCNLTIRTGAPMQVTLADGSVKTTGEVAHSKFKAHTTKGVDYCESNMMLRVLPLGIQVDVVLGGRWLRSLSQVTLDYAGNGSVSFSTIKSKGVSV